MIYFYKYFKSNNDIFTFYRGHNENDATAIGIVCGLLAFAAAVLTFGFLYMRRRHKSKSRVTPVTYCHWFFKRFYQVTQFIEISGQKKILNQKNLMNN